MSVRETIDPNSSHWAWLAFDLWFHRTQRGLSLAQTALIVRVTRATVSNWEAGRFRPGDEHMALLDKAWDTGGHFQRLLYYARTGHDPDWFKQYIQYERAAEIIKIYHGKTIPLLTQTEAYAHALLRTAGRMREAEAKTKERMKRQEVLARPEPPYLWVLLDQEVLECRVGDRTVMREQLAHLLKMGEDPRNSIRIVGRAVGWHPGHDGSLQILKIKSREVAYVGAQIGGRLIEGGDEVTTIGIRFEQIGALALSRDASRKLIERTMETYR
ncbi:helix-turn-helix transcriptional regulator [Actinomadura sp. NEAU-AAG7]|uniref:helix-turn-helix domain-containing protein n=1 Tax=Actinomadura sp. NEAU-AAG7 TaxID=2839640 RepID=UPI001BE491AC|nr:helix-turn-helix transcriptional regulator [Actinomadura sp. NEAU-AAG7]MBT2211249.1 helix-turn-helix transcriptional regulator [Actinomadura sp. NEAU-AAG7]